MTMYSRKAIEVIKSIASATGVLSFYHFLLSFLGALWYGFPSRRMTVIGVTGTKGKTTTSNLIAYVLQGAGDMTGLPAGAQRAKVGLATTVNFKIGERSWTNMTKQTMLGRFALQRLLREMADAGCTHAVVETSSEGILQYRHRFIDYRIAVFTNLSPEHIERHGSFEAYRSAKVKLFEHVAKRKDGIGVYNLDDASVEYFLAPNIARKIGYAQLTTNNLRLTTTVQSTDVSFESDGTQFTVRAIPARTESVRSGGRYTIPLLGQGNLSNALATIAVAQSLGVSDEKIASALKTVPQISGRMEIMKNNGITVIVDYAHEPKSLEEVYKTAQLFQPKRMIGILGSQGGGRDVWKREAMGKIAGQYLDIVILTNEDPYDEEPMHIMEGVEKGVLAAKKEGKPEIYKIVDRKEAIKKAVSLAESGDVVILTGKGGEVWMCVEDGKKIPWNESKIVEEILSEY